MEGIGSKELVKCIKYIFEAAQEVLREILNFSFLLSDHRWHGGWKCLRRWYEKVIQTNLSIVSPSQNNKTNTML